MLYNLRFRKPSSDILLGVVNQAFPLSLVVCTVRVMNVTLLLRRVFCYGCELDDRFIFQINNLACGMGLSTAVSCRKKSAEPDGTCAETRFRLSPKRTSPFKSVGESVQSTAGSRGVRISVSNAGYTTFRGRVALGYVLRASDQRARAFSPLSLERTNMYVNGAVLLGSE